MQPRVPLTTAGTLLLGAGTDVGLRVLEMGGAPRDTALSTFRRLSADVSPLTSGLVAAATFLIWQVHSASRPAFLIWQLPNLAGAPDGCSNAIGLILAEMQVRDHG